MKVISVIDLSQNDLKDSFMQKILYELVDKEVYVKIEFLILKACGFTERVVPIVGSCLNKMPNIKGIDIKFNDIPSQSLKKEL